MRTMIMAFAIAAVFLCVSGYAVPPAYEGPFGNPEEPALRVIKWPWLGLKKLVVSTHEGLKSGMAKESLCETGKDGTSGAWQGSKTLVDHTARGMVYAPLPEKAPLRETDTYEEHAMAFIEAQLKPACEEQATCAEEAPCETEGAETEEPVKYLDLKIEESAVEKAQRRYVPLRAAARARVWCGGGNLLRLAREFVVV